MIFGASGSAVQAVALVESISSDVEYYSPVIKKGAALALLVIQLLISGYLVACIMQTSLLCPIIQANSYEVSSGAPFTLKR